MSAKARDFIEELRWRGFLHSATEGAEKALAEAKATGYIGFDPTAPSLHVGNLLAIMGLVHLQRHGHSPIAIVGGGTGMIGDPSGKSKERTLMTADDVERNLQGIRGQLEKFLDFEAAGNPARIVNNADWLGKISTLEFLRDVGKHFSVNGMLGKESVDRRLTSEEGISFTEFSYMLLQAYDFLVLFDRFGCGLQMGGSDQWGNITAGINLIRRVRGGSAYGIVFPLLTTSAGTKFGKTESGTVWLDPKRTSPYKLYQFFINTDDTDVERLLKLLTLLPEGEVREIVAEFGREPGRRLAQRRLAEEVTRAVHGDAELAKARAASEVLFSGELGRLTLEQVLQIFDDVPSAVVSAPQGSVALVDMLTQAKLAASKGEARRTIEGGGVYVNGRQEKDVKKVLTRSEAVEGKVFVLRKGAKNYALIHLQ